MLLVVSDDESKVSGGAAPDIQYHAVAGTLKLISARFAGNLLIEVEQISGKAGSDRMSATDEINALPRNRLGYRTLEELFDDQFDLILSNRVFNLLLQFSKNKISNNKKYSLWSSF